MLSAGTRFLGVAVFSMLVIGMSGVASAAEIPTDGAVKDVVRAESFWERQDRLAGADRVETALEVAKSYSHWEDTAVLVSGSGYADALSAVPLAAGLRAPLLLTSPRSLDSRVLEYLQTKHYRKVFIVGGRSAISESVFSDLTANGFDTRRIHGADRYETSLEVAWEITNVQQAASLRLVLADGENFADALSAGPYAYRMGGAVLLIPSSGVTDAQRAFIDKHSTRVIAVGGAAVRAGVTLRQSVDNVYGQNRYETAVKVAKASLDTPQGIVTVSGENFPDALCAGVPAALSKFAFLLTPGNDLNQSYIDYLKDNTRFFSGEPINIIGGTSVLSGYVATQTERLSLGRLRPMLRWETPSLQAKETQVADPVYTPDPTPAYNAKKHMVLAGRFTSTTTGATIVEREVSYAGAGANPGIYAQINDRGQLEVYRDSDGIQGDYNIRVRCKAVKKGLEDSDTVNVVITVTLP